MNTLTTEHTPDNIIAQLARRSSGRTGDIPLITFSITRNLHIRRHFLPNAWQIIWKARDLK